MSNKLILKNYLLEKENPFLLDDNNNGKTIMLSGAWGAGKTYFWKNDIEPNLLTKLKKKKKACVYVSLYGKNSIEAVKDEILFKAYESVKEENELKKKAISAFGIGSRALSFSAFGFKLDAKELSEKLKAYDEEKKIEEAESFIVDGGVICLDDFERKSKNIDLNDLFGFISQLAIDMSCKIVIILNSDVFKGKEAEVFRQVKEKTVNKFFYYNPSIEELFESISKEKKYDPLNEYKEYILSVIKETKELNARIYIQVLDNCLEWFNSDKIISESIIQFLVLVNINFILNHLVFETKIIERDKNASQKLLNEIASFNSKDQTHYHHQEKIVQKIKIDIKLKNNKEYIELYDCIEDNYRSENFIDLVVKNIKNHTNKTIKENTEFYINYVYNHQNIIRSLSVFKLFNIDNNIEYNDTFNEIANFIETGILI